MVYALTILKGKNSEVVFEIVTVAVIKFPINTPGGSQRINLNLLVLPSASV